MPAACSASMRPVSRSPTWRTSGLYALQHRGQESAGISVSDGQTITVVKDMGLVTQVFDERRLAPLEGHLAIGHNRYSTTGSSTWRNAQPVYRSVGDAGLRARPQRQSHQHRGAGRAPGDAPRACCTTPTGPLDSTTDSALVAELIAAEYARRPPLGRPRPRARAREGAARISTGGFSFVLMDDAHLIGARDPHGFWPLVLGRIEGGWVLASETAALDIVGAHFVREIEPGEMIVIERERDARAALRRARARSSACSSSSTSPGPTPTSTARACTRHASGWARSSPARRRSRPTW